MTSEEERRSSSGAKLVGDLALLVCLVLFVLNSLSPQGWASLGTLLLAIVGVGLRIESAIVARYDQVVHSDQDVSA